MKNKYWIAFSSIEQIDSKFIQRLFNYFGNIELAFNADLNELKNIEGAWGKNSNGELWIDEDAFNQVEDIYSQREEALRYAVDY